MSANGARDGWFCGLTDAGENGDVRPGDRGGRIASVSRRPYESAVSTMRSCSERCAAG